MGPTPTKWQVILEARVILFVILMVNMGRGGGVRESSQMDGPVRGPWWTSTRPDGQTGDARVCFEGREGSMATRARVGGV